MKKLLTEFKTFAMRGNLMDMAIGVILGGAFGKIVSALVANIIMPLLGLLIGSVNFSDLSLTLKGAETNPNTGTAMPAIIMNYGGFIQTIFDFLIIAFSIFMVIRTLNKLMHKNDQAKKDAPPPPTPDVVLLQEIRDLLKKDSDSK